MHYFGCNFPVQFSRCNDSDEIIPMQLHPCATFRCNVFDAKIGCPATGPYIYFSRKLRKKICNANFWLLPGLSNHPLHSFRCKIPMQLSDARNLAQDPDATFWMHFSDAIFRWNSSDAIIAVQYADWAPESNQPSIRVDLNWVSG